MIPTIEQVMSRRSIARTLLRASCLLLVVIGLLPLLWTMGDDLVDGDLFRLLPHYLSRNSNEVSWLIVNVAVAATLWLLQGRLLRLLVPWPEARCPQCGYRLERNASPRCPECGCGLPPALVNRETGEPPPGS
ncbi:MAG: hypothetical protein ACYTGG_00615 [Planctomycetota bacterium]|jgi:hypothetical protein